jgi:hypothetical protein
MFLHERAVLHMLRVVMLGIGRVTLGCISVASSKRSV